MQETVGQASTGQMLRDRFRLERFVERRSKADATPGQSFPRIGKNRYGQIRRKFTGNTTHLGTGSFGDVWEAFDTRLKKNVAVKIFYQGNKYMTWKSADRRGLKELEESAQECNLVKDILKPSNRRLYPIGAARICECYDEYITDAKGTHEVVFLVQEMCGRSLDEAIIQYRKEADTVNYHKARAATKQLLQAIAFLQEFNPPLIHHDLKPANVCINDNGEIKVIDWGATVNAKRSNMYRSSAATPLYTPPEAADSAKSFDEPWHSYDSYAVGLMHMYFICPMIEANDWYYRKPLKRTMVSSAFRKRCSSHYYNKSDPYGAIDEDIDLIDKLSNVLPSMRSEPLELLDHEALVDVATPDILEDEVEKLLQFKVGDKIKYWSTTKERWIDGLIKAVHPAAGTYDLVYKDGPPDNGRAMKDGADPGRVMSREEDLLASVDDNMLIRPDDLREGNGLLGASVIDPQWVHKRTPIVGPIKVQFSKYLQIDAPELRWTSRDTLEVKFYIVPRFGASCHVTRAVLDCLYPERRAYQALLFYRTDYTKALVDVRRDDRNIGATCYLEAEADIGNAPLSESGPRKSYSKKVTLVGGVRTP